MTGDPHALDTGETLAGLVLAAASATGLLDGAVRGRSGWQRLGVLGDDALGGLLVVGIAPAGWTVPPEALLGLTPRELARARWPRPTGGGLVYVTENPSALTAISDAASALGPGGPVVCTSGTPSALEIRALDALAATGWHVAVRADFDPAGLAHVRALLSGVHSATTWRMGTGDYQHSLDPGAGQHPGLAALTALDTPWDRQLADAMRTDGRAACEEALVNELVADVRGAGVGRPRES